MPYTRKRYKSQRLIKELPQVGKSKKVSDRKVKALRPGVRISKNKKKYTETRKNRSDKKRRLI